MLTMLLVFLFQLATCPDLGDPLLHLRTFEEALRAQPNYFNDAERHECSLGFQITFLTLADLINESPATTQSLILKLMNFHFLLAIS